jgi:rubrerythrin
VGSKQATQTVSPDQAKSDASVLASLVELERMAVLAYSTARARLGGEARRTAGLIMQQEQAHERVLDAAIRRLGAHPVPPRPARDYTSEFPPLRGATDVLRFALDLENTQVAAYGDSLGSIVTPELRVTIASILGAEAEHTSAILGELREPQAPQAFVPASPPT